MAATVSEESGTESQLSGRRVESRWARRKRPNRLPTQNAIRAVPGVSRTPPNAGALIATTPSGFPANLLCALDELRSPASAYEIWLSGAVPAWRRTAAPPRLMPRVTTGSPGDHERAARTAASTSRGSRTPIDA